MEVLEKNWNLDELVPEISVFKWDQEQFNIIVDFRGYLTSMKIVIPENFDFQYSKNFLRMRFFRDWATNSHRSSQTHVRISLLDFRISIRY